jgi:lysophospholipase L1-like esterase
VKRLILACLLSATAAYATAPIRVACLGDSITFGARVDAEREAYPVFLQQLLGSGYEVKNFGRSGATMWHGSPNHAAQQLPAAVAFAPQVAIVMFGINDTRNEGVDYWDHFAEFEADAAAVLDTLLAAPSPPRILLGLSTANLADMPDMKPERIAVLTERQPRLDAVREKLRKIAARYAGRGVAAVDFNAATIGRHELYNPDGVHFNPAGYRYLAEVLKPRVETIAHGR